MEEAIRRAAAALDGAEALLAAAGAGMGVDSGLPDFRGNEGFWRAYPPFRGMAFEEMAHPRWFDRDPALAWGFYGHRLALYRSTRPHAGFEVLRRWGERLPAGAFVFTTNVDGQFQRAGFPEDRVLEYHGTLMWQQCLRDCGAGLFPAGEAPDVDPETFRARGPLPACPRCGGLARPNVLMFGDGGWDDRRAEVQRRNLERWLAPLDRRKLVVVECGAGTAIPSVRSFSEMLQGRGATLIRVNVREAHGPPGTISLPLGAREALERIDAARSA